MNCANEVFFVSPSGVRSVWLRHDLQTFRKRLTAIEKKAAAEDLVLTEAQIAALERKREDEAVSGEIETAHPGYLGSQDTFYIGKHERGWTHPPADLHLYVLEGGLCQALHDEDTDHGGRSAE